MERQGYGANEEPTSIDLPICALPLLGAAQPASSVSSDEYAAGREVVRGLNRIVAAKGAEDTFVTRLGGAKQVVTVRGADRDNPILIYVPIAAPPITCKTIPIPRDTAPAVLVRTEDAL